MTSRVINSRRLICRQYCPAKCELYLKGEIKHDDPNASCPVNWSGNWDSYSQAPRIVERAAVSEPAIEDKLERGRKAWHALALAGLAGTITPLWLTETFRPMIPRYGCSCLNEWDAVLDEIPLREKDQFAWSVDAHNAVNARLRLQGMDRPHFTLSQALRRFTGPP